MQLGHWNRDLRKVKRPNAEPAIIIDVLFANSMPLH